MKPEHAQFSDCNRKNATRLIPVKWHDAIQLLTLTMVLYFCPIYLNAQSFLHTKGHDIVDETGKKVMLRGVGLGNWMLPEGYMWKFGDQGDRPRRIEKIVFNYLGEQKAEQFWKAFRKNYITDADIKRIAELGFNSVRPALNARLFLTEGEQNVFVDEGFELLDSLIARCKRHHLYVIIDMHGAPGGQTGQNIDDSPNNEPELFMHQKNQDLLVKLWVKIAERYKDEPIVAAYDLLNEPLPDNTGASAKYKQLLVPLYERLIKAIREVDKKHMFTLEGYNWANNWSVFTKPLDSNMFFQFHYYCWNTPDNLNDISEYVARREQLNTPVWVGETGEKHNGIYYATTQYFEKNNIGWSFWPWKKMETTNTPYSIKMPKGWSDVVAHSKGGPATSREKPEAIFNELLENIKLENCLYFSDVVNAIFRRVPLKLEAENYGHDGYGKSFVVKDQTKRSPVYRTKEPVQIKMTSNNSAPAIELQAGEWTAYKCDAQQQASYKPTLRIKASSQAKVSVSVNGQKEQVSVAPGDWKEVGLGAKNFRKDANEIKFEVEEGSVLLDYINIQ